MASGSIKPSTCAQKNDWRFLTTFLYLKKNKTKWKQADWWNHIIPFPSPKCSGCVTFLFTVNTVLKSSTDPDTKRIKDTHRIFSHYGYPAEGQQVFVQSSWLVLCPLFDRILVFPLTESKALPAIELMSNICSEWTHLNFPTFYISFYGFLSGTYTLPSLFPSALNPCLSCFPSSESWQNSSKSTLLTISDLVFH